MASDFQHFFRNAVRNCQDCQGTSIAIELGHSGTVKIVKARLLQLKWDTAELSRLSRHVYCNWIGTQRNCQDWQGTSIAIELGHSGTVKIVKARLLQLNWDTAELSRLTRYVYCNWIGTQQNCQDCQGMSIAIELGHSGTVKIVKARLLQLNWDTAELSRLTRYVYCNWIETQRNCQDWQGTSIAIQLGHSGIVKIDKVRLLQLNWDTAELLRLTRYVYYNWTGTQRNCQDCQCSSNAIELGHISGTVKIVNVRLLQGIGTQRNCQDC